MAKAQPTIHEVQTLVAQGRRDEAIAMLTQLLRRDPNSHALHLFAGQLAASAADHGRAVTHAEAALRNAPSDAPSLRLLATSLSALGRSGEAIEALRTLVAAAPRDGSALCALANECLRADRLQDAENWLDHAIATVPSFAPAWRDRAQLQLATGRAAEAAATLDRALIAHPRDANLAQFLASTLNYVPDAPSDRIAKTHALAARLLESDAPSAPLSNPRDPDRPLSIGFLSPDLHAHSVSFFLLPLVTHLNAQSLTPTFLWTGKTDDAFTERYRRVAATPDRWRPCRSLSTGDLCALIRRLGIDVLVDLSGHTTGNAMPVFARRPAPIQISAIGYPNSTGLRAIDARLGDSITDPQDHRADESIMRVEPCFLCYKPPEATPDDEPHVSDPDRPPTFGSFNALQKVHPGVIDLWSRLLVEVPGSRLVLKGDLRLSAVGERLLSSFESRGIDRSRLTLLSHTASPAEARRLYALMDVALDTFPYNGTTTTCEALWMGVPVVTMPGATHASRVSASLLSAIGMPDLIARDPGGYLRIAADLARDRPRVLELRNTLRPRMLSSTLCDATSYARRFETAVRTLWRAWCASA